MTISALACVSLVTVAATLAGGWLVTTKVTDYWDKIKKNREMNLAAAHDFQRLYGEVVAIWKTWNALKIQQDRRVGLSSCAGCRRSTRGRRRARPTGRRQPALAQWSLLAQITPLC
jgi:hypothetical protein